ncbi:MAG: hypothetical protein METHP_00636 [Methanoregula sp. SKADARSKE-2]|nr:MAG: hypothetical protein METHP_00636 [Methanoregula sp. SKADARSKE-2]
MSICCTLSLSFSSGSSSDHRRAGKPHRKRPDPCPEKNAPFTRLFPHFCGNYHPYRRHSHCGMQKPGGCTKLATHQDPIRRASVLVEKYPAPGTHLKVDGSRMHIRCVGAGSPTAILEAGSNRYLSLFHGNANIAHIRPDPVSGTSLQGGDARDRRRTFRRLNKASEGGQAFKPGKIRSGVYRGYAGREIMPWGVADPWAHPVNFAPGAER